MVAQPPLRLGEQVLVQHLLEALDPCRLDR